MQRLPHSSFLVEKVTIRIHYWALSSLHTVEFTARRFAGRWELCGHGRWCEPFVHRLALRGHVQLVSSFPARDRMNRRDDGPLVRS